MVSQVLKRVIVASLAAASLSLLFQLGYACPFWRLGIPCPACGASRACFAALHGNVLAAFAENICFLYWGYIGASMYGSLFAFALGFTNDINTVARRCLDGIPLWIHAPLATLSLAYNLYHRGLNPNGYVFWRFS